MGARIAASSAERRVGANASGLPSRPTREAVVLRAARRRNRDERDRHQGRAAGMARPCARPRHGRRGAGAPREHRGESGGDRDRVDGRAARGDASPVACSRRAHCPERSPVGPLGAVGSVGGSSAQTEMTTHMADSDLPSFHGIIGRSPAMRALFGRIERVAPIDVPVLILGESGTGKELVASAIHRISARAGRRCEPINCADLTRDLLRSELFGHERGAFSGAVAKKAGVLAVAHGGTVFLDEVGELATERQVCFSGSCRAAKAAPSVPRPRRASTSGSSRRPTGI